MKTIIFDKNDYKSYKDFYEDIFIKLDGKNNIDFEDYPDLNCSADMLYEFLWYNYKKSINYVLKNFDREAIRTEKPFENYKLNLIISDFEDFVKEYPNNKLEFINE